MTDPAAPEPILLVEDDPDVRSILAEHLEASGFTVIEATGPEDVAELLDRGLAPPVMVTDIDLGSATDGIALADEMHRQLPGVPVVFITGHLEMLRDRGLKDGEYVVPKPFALAALTGVVRRCAAASVD